MKIYLWFIIYLAVMSLIALILYKVDKEKAKRSEWRTKEKTLLGFGFLGGAVGALAGAAYPGRVFKGNKSPGRTGRDTVTIQNVKLVKVIEDRNLLLVKGAVPGGKGSLLRIHYAVKGQGK